MHYLSLGNGLPQLMLVRFDRASVNGRGDLVKITASRGKIVEAVPKSGCQIQRTCPTFSHDSFFCDCDRLRSTCLLVFSVLERCHALARHRSLFFEV